MSIDQLKEKENSEKKKRFERKGKKLNRELAMVAEMEALSENNLKAKAAMVTELVDMGFSLKAIERILGIKSEVLDRLL
ncbi:MAG: hypothetical protein ACT6FE_00895 [Methanosarcinaceae archaeon]